MYVEQIFGGDYRPRNVPPHHLTRASMLARICADVSVRPARTSAMASSKAAFSSGVASTRGALRSAMSTGSESSWVKCSWSMSMTVHRQTGEGKLFFLVRGAEVFLVVCPVSFGETRAQSQNDKPTSIRTPVMDAACEPPIGPLTGMTTPTRARRARALLRGIVLLTSGSTTNCAPE